VLIIEKYRYETDLSTSALWISTMLLRVFTECHSGKFGDAMMSQKN